MGLCDFFKNQSLSKQKEILKTHKVCYICLSPKSSCRKESDPSICLNQVHYNFKCRQCGDLKHHTVMCPQNASYYQSEYQTQGRQDAQSFYTQSSHPQPPNSTSSFPNSGSSPSPVNASCAISKHCDNPTQLPTQLQHNSIQLPPMLGLHGNWFTHHLPTTQLITTTSNF